MHIDQLECLVCVGGRIGGGRQPGGVDGRGSSGGRRRGSARRTAQAHTNGGGGDKDEGLCLTKTKFRSRALVRLYRGGSFSTGL